MTYAQYSTEIQDVLDAWQPYIDDLTQAENWQDVVSGTEPKATGCGPIYEPGNPIDRPTESFAIADMRSIAFAEPHYHTNGETEIYFVLAGLGRVVVGNKEMPIAKGDVIVTPPDTGHYVIPTKDLVLVVINNPPFSPANSVDLIESNPDVGFDHEQFMRLTSQAT